MSLTSGAILPVIMYSWKAQRLCSLPTLSRLATLCCGKQRVPLGSSTAGALRLRSDVSARHGDSVIEQREHHYLIQLPPRRRVQILKQLP